MSGKTELRMFDATYPQIAAYNSYYEKIFPDTNLGKLDDNDIVFTMKGTNTEYLDLNDTLFTIRLRVLKEFGGEYGSDLNFMPANYFMNALIKDIKLTMNNVPIEECGDYYPYKATLEDMFNFDNATKAIQLRSKGYYEDDTERSVSVIRSNPIELCGALRLDFFKQPLYLLPNITVQLRIRRTTNTRFVFEGLKSAYDRNVEIASPKVHIYQAFLRVRKVTMNPSIVEGHLLGLKNNLLATYSYSTSKVVRYTIAKGSLEFKKENIFPVDYCPKLVIVCFVSQSAYNGDSIYTDPFAFKHCNVKRLNMYVNGSSVPYRDGYRTNFDDSDDSDDGTGGALLGGGGGGGGVGPGSGAPAHAVGTTLVAAPTTTGTPTKVTDVYSPLGNVDSYFRSIVQCCQHLNCNVNNGIKYETFKSGKQALFVFNLTSDFDFRVVQQARSVVARLDIKFSEALDEAVNCLLYSVCDSTLRIRKDYSIDTSGLNN